MIPGADVYEIAFEDDVTLFILNIEQITKELSDYIEEYIVSICEGDSGSCVENVKVQLLNYLDRKGNSNLRMGAVSEFFNHLLLNTYKYKQECLFENLEENSIKKGFDGYYSKDGNEWLMESKSGYITSKSISHSNKLKEAYKDLKDKLAGNVENNPWKNAYNHASHIDVGTDKSIRAHIKKMSDKFVQLQFADISGFNIIPTSTIFLNDTWEHTNIDDLKTEIEEVIKNFHCKKLIVICATKISVEILQQILRGQGVDNE